MPGACTAAHRIDNQLGGQHLFLTGVAVGHTGTRDSVRLGRYQLDNVVAIQNREVPDRANPPPDMGFEKWPAGQVTHQPCRVGEFARPVELMPAESQGDT